MNHSGNENNPLISIILPVYNCQKHVGIAIESILNQTFTEFELLVLNDGSTDKTLEIIHEYTKDKRLKVISRPNKGLVYTLNEGLSMARGKYIARMDADDISCENRLELQFNYMESYPDIVLLGTGSELITEDGVFIRNIIHPSGNELLDRMLDGNFIAHPTVMMRRSILERVGKYRKAFEQAEDYDLWLRFLSDGYQIDNLPEILLKYRQTLSGISFSNRRSQDTVARMARVAFDMRQILGRDDFDEREDNVNIDDLKNAMGSYIGKYDYAKLELLWYGCYILDSSELDCSEENFKKNKSKFIRESVGCYYFRRSYFSLIKNDKYNFLFYMILSMFYTPLFTAFNVFYSLMRRYKKYKF